MIEPLDEFPAIRSAHAFSRRRQEPSSAGAGAGREASFYAQKAYSIPTAIVRRLRRPASVNGNSTLPDTSQLPTGLNFTPAVPSISVRLAARGSNSRAWNRPMTAAPAPRRASTSATAERSRRARHTRMSSDEIETSRFPQRAADEIAHQREPRTRDELDARRVVDLIGKRGAQESAEGTGRPCRRPRCSRCSRAGRNGRVRSTRPAGTLPGCRRRRAARSRRRSAAGDRPPRPGLRPPPQKVILASKHDVAQARPRGRSCCTVCVASGLPDLERMNVRGGRGHQADDAAPARSASRFTLTNGTARPDVPAIGDAVGRKHGGRVRRGFERERRFDDIAFEGRVQAVVPVQGSNVKPVKVAGSGEVQQS